jgi:uridylate kinase
MTKAKYKRIILKISGEALQGQHHFGIDPEVMTSIGRQIRTVCRTIGVQVAVVIGAGTASGDLRLPKRAVWTGSWQII